MAYSSLSLNDPVQLSGFDASIYVETIDWSAIANDRHFFFGFVECARLTMSNPHFKTIWDDVRRTIPCGAYQRLCSAASGGDHASVFIEAVAGANGFRAFDLPPVLDVEADPDGHLAEPSWYLTAIDEWVEVITSRFASRPIIYTNPSFWSRLAASTKYAAYPLWIAHYNVARPDVPKPWHGYCFWQYAQGIACNGFGGKEVDLDFFNGSLERLTKLAQQWQHL